MAMATCEICGLESPLTELHYGWGGYTCEGNIECRPPLGPRQRDVADLTTAVLDDLEYVADEAEHACRSPEIDHATLRALIDAARRDLSRDELIGPCIVTGPCP